MRVLVFHHTTLNTVTQTRTSCGPSYCPELHYSNVHVLVFHLTVVNSFTPICTYKCSILLPWIPSLKHARLGVITVNAFTQTCTSWCLSLAHFTTKNAFIHRITSSCSSLTFHHKERLYSQNYILVLQPKHFIIKNAFTHTCTSSCPGLNFHHKEHLYSCMHILVFQPRLLSQRTPLLTHAHLGVPV